MTVQVTLKHMDITDKILQAFLQIVYPRLGYGFLEKVYENSLVIALKDLGLEVKQQAKIDGYFQNQVVGDYPEFRRKVYDNSRKNITWH